jgi:uncharacterized MAPEG superfamily protein
MPPARVPVFLRSKRRVTSLTLPLWRLRADRAHVNAVEAFAPLVIIAHIAGKANATTAFWTISFFWLRLAHAVVYLLAVPYIRTIFFTFVATAGLFWEVIR